MSKIKERIENIKKYAKSRHDSLMAQSEGIYNGLKLELDSLGNLIETMPHGCCGKHGMTASEILAHEKSLFKNPTKEEMTTVRGMGELTGKPDLPLRGRVAEALGYAVGRPSEDRLLIMTKGGKEESKMVPFYGTDLTLAMGALEEYLKIASKNRKVGKENYTCDFQLCKDGSGHAYIYCNDGEDTTVYFGVGRENYVANNMLWAETIEEAICLLIVKHADQI